VGIGRQGILRNSVGIPNGILILMSDEFTSIYDIVLVHTEIHVVEVGV